MEKVKVTQDQADALERTGDKGDVLATHIKYGWVHHDNECLNSLSIDEMARALYVGYEVIPSFKAGDWIVHEQSGYIGIITKITNGRYVYGDARQDGFLAGFAQEVLRHATESEVAEEIQRRWWKNYDRDVWELKPKDVLVAEDGGYLVEVKRVLSCGSPLFVGGVKSTPLDEVEEMFKVVCFAQDRKDV
ncbi:hypothetical protein CAI16_05285 [Virgibacillus dokdonensis]|uniref:Uncharacterized protein n=1 Tax=Virgibacillus dokdonensis TaxID=302167 RepID=A0A3E0WWA2_9BACI|nr:hypothetical protein [Virgibacillus dokdonensis]RFA36207.1 hypothetical protein CAI16_05285 [Virgibacillus dokdonensis]